MTHQVTTVIREELALEEEKSRHLLAIMEQTAQAALQRFHPAACSVTIVLSDDAELQALNQAWRGLDRPTDVLSFAAEENAAIASVSRLPYLGDIILSLPRATMQAQEYGHSLEREMGFLVAHGVLHVLGYDHMNPQDEQEMLEAQQQIMNDMHLPRH